MVTVEPVLARRSLKFGHVWRIWPVSMNVGVVGVIALSLWTSRSGRKVRVTRAGDVPVLGRCTVTLRNPTGSYWAGGSRDLWGVGGDFMLQDITL